MKKKQMSQNQTYWERIIKAAHGLLSLKPWEYMYETDVFGIKLPGKKDEYFISVMGQGGEHYAVTAYKGMNALQLVSEHQDENRETIPEEILLMSQVMISFEEYADLNDTEKQVVKETGLQFPKDKSPNVQETIPGLIPQEPDEERLPEIATVFEQALNVIRRAQKDIDIILPDDDESIFIRQKKSGKWSDGFQKLVYQNETLPVTLDVTAIEKIKEKPKKPHAFVIDVRLMMPPTLSDDGQPFFPFLLLFIDKKKGTIEHHELLEPLPDYETMLSTVPEKIIDFFTKKPFKPFLIDGREGYIGSFLHELGKAIEIQVNIKQNLPQINEVMQVLEQEAEDNQQAND